LFGKIRTSTIVLVAKADFGEAIVQAFDELLANLLAVFRDDQIFGARGGLRCERGGQCQREYGASYIH
jgi:hypothetical protein